MSYWEDLLRQERFRRLTPEDLQQLIHERFVDALIENDPDEIIDTLIDQHGDDFFNRVAVAEAKRRRRGRKPDTEKLGNVVWFLGIESIRASSQDHKPPSVRCVCTRLERRTGVKWRTLQRKYYDGLKILTGGNAVRVNQ